MSINALGYEVVHHLYREPGDLLPFCGVTPGSDLGFGWWHTGHDEETLLICVDEGLTACMTCLSPEALGGWSPLYVDEDEAV